MSTITDYKSSVTNLCILHINLMKRFTKARRGNSLTPSLLYKMGRWILRMVSQLEKPKVRRKIRIRRWRRVRLAELKSFQEEWSQMGHCIPSRAKISPHLLYVTLSVQWIRAKRECTVDGTRNQAIENTRWMSRSCW